MYNPNYANDTLFYFFIIAVIIFMISRITGTFDSEKGSDYEEAINKMKSITKSNDINQYSEVIKVRLKLYKGDKVFHRCSLFIESNKFRIKAWAYEVQGIINESNVRKEYVGVSKVSLLQLSNEIVASRNLEVIDSIEKYYKTYLQLKRVNEEEAAQLKIANEKAATQLRIANEKAATQLRIENNRPELIKRQLDNQERLKAIAQEQMNIETEKIKTEEIARKRLREEEMQKLENSINIVLRSATIPAEKVAALARGFIQSIDVNLYTDTNYLLAIEFELVKMNTLLRSIVDATDTMFAENDVYTKYDKIDFSDSVSWKLNRVISKKSKLAQKWMEEFKQFEKIIMKYFEVPNNLIDIVSWTIIEKERKKYFEKLWEEEYSYLFDNDVDIELNQWITSFVRCQEIDHTLTKVLGLFTYSLMGKKKFDDKINDNYFLCFEILNDKVSVELEKVKLEVYEEYLLRPKINQPYTIQYADSLSGHSFEHFVAKIFERLAYKVKVTKGSGDQGVDVVAEKRGVRIGIQTKNYASYVTNTAVQEVVAGLQIYNCLKGYVVTTHYFTESAKELAMANNVELWDRDTLIEKIELLNN